MPLPHVMFCTSLRRLNSRSANGLAFLLLDLIVSAFVVTASDLLLVLAVVLLCSSYLYDFMQACFHLFDLYFSLG